MEAFAFGRPDLDYMGVVKDDAGTDEVRSFFMLSLFNKNDRRTNIC